MDANFIHSIQDGNYISQMTTTAMVAAPYPFGNCFVENEC